MDEVNLNDWLIDAPIISRRNGLGYLDQSVKESNAVLDKDIDIFAIGFEEIVDLNAQNIVNASDVNANIWKNKIEDCLKKQGEYEQVIVENLQLVGVCLYVYVLKKHLNFIRDVRVTRTKTGLGGNAGNKGGVVLRFVFYNTSMCFVCSHFAAHQKEIRQRNEDFKYIYENSDLNTGGSGPAKVEVKNHDYVFWCGDLNYRIDMANDECRNYISLREWNKLLQKDQLSNQKAHNLVFRDFVEPPILFPPTYKYNVNEDTYDRSEKCRVPAWTGTHLSFQMFILDRISN